jgi:hypothetical protein
VPPQIIDPSAVKPENWVDDEEDMIPGVLIKFLVL